MCQNPELFNTAFLEACAPVSRAITDLGLFIMTSPDLCPSAKANMTESLAQMVAWYEETIRRELSHYLLKTVFANLPGELAATMAIVQSHAILESEQLKPDIMP